VIITAHQPLYIPWLGFFHKLAAAEMVCILDNVQYSKGDFVNRNLIRSKDGSEWLNIEIIKPGTHRIPISELRFRNSNWQQKHLDKIKINYKSSRFHDKYLSRLSQIYENNTSGSIADLNIALIEWILMEFEISVKIIKCSELEVSSKKSDLILDICKTLGADKYLSGINGNAYLDNEKFESNGIQVKTQKYFHPVYKQLHPSFLPNMSALDLLFTHGHEARNILFTGNSTNWNDFNHL